MEKQELRQMSQKHVFVVNGAAEFLEVVRWLLESEQYNVTTTNYVPRTFEQISALQPDLLVIDLAVYHRAGWPLLERLHQETATTNIPVIVTSTDPRFLEEIKAEPHRYGGQHFLIKPFGINDLLEAVDSLLGSQVVNETG